MSLVATERSVTSPEGHRKIDGVVSVMRAAMDAGVMAPVSMVPNNHFADGLYVRELPMQARALWVSKIHRERHPFFILAGRAAVWSDDKGWHEIVGPHWGFTEPGTRRVIWTIEDTVWITVHANPENTDSVDELEQRIIEPRDMPDALTGPAFQQFLAAITEGEYDAIPA